MLTIKPHLQPSLVLLLVLTLGRNGWAQPMRVSLPGNVPTAAAQLAPVGTVPATSRLYLAIGVPLRNQAELSTLLRELYTPGSASFHKFLTPQEFTARFGPTEQDYQAVKKFATGNGLRIAGEHSNRLVLDVEGNAADVGRAFQVSFQRYQHPAEPRTFYAPDREASVPAGVPVADVWGLSDYYRPTPLARRVDPATVSPLNYNGSGPGGSYQGLDFRNAYSPGTALRGAGQTAAVAEFDGYYASDISTYTANCGYTNVPLQNVLVDGVSGTPGYSGIANAVAEVSLDIELIIAIAPGLSKLMVYEGSNPYDVFNRIATDNVAKQISCSWAWGKGPTFDWGHPGTRTLDSQLQQMAAQGQSFFQASGDSDAYTGTQVLSSSGGPIPVDSIYVTSVGGTSLTMNGTGASWASETVWNWGNNTGSGGGISPNYTIPYWQTNVDMSANSGSTVNRNIPDVALTADAVNVVYNNGSSGSFGGTSCAAPLWAGFTAMINEQAAASGGAPVGFLNPALYAIASGPSYSACFHDITTGNNIGNNTPGLFNAVPNYDLATGLGTPNGTNLINALAPLSTPVFLSQPASQTVTNGAKVVLSATAGGQAPLYYRWLFYGTNLAPGANLSGTTSNVLTISSASLTNAGPYQLVVTNSFGAATSSVATLTVLFPPLFTSQPTNQTVVVGGNANFNATVSGATPLAYQWRQNGTNFANGVNVSGATSNFLSLTSVTLASAGNYTLAATNVYGSATSSVATLTVVQPATITVPPTAQSVQCGSNALFTVSAAGTLPLHYQWTLDSTALAGATTTALLLTNVHLPDHTVGVVVTNLYGNSSDTVALGVQDTLPPAIALNGGSPLYVELGGTFTDPGAAAYDLCAGTVPVNVSGTVNANAVGTNSLVYTANDGNGNTGTATRTVVVRDTTPPTIQWSFTNFVLVAGSTCTATLTNVTGTNFIQATDLSEPLTITQSPTNGTALPLGTNRVVLTVLDAYGNAAYSTNSVAVLDLTPPVITLNGSSPLYVELGGAFTDPGATASDACAGTVPVSISGTVNTGAVGTNTLLYAASDGHGNTNSTTRAVIVRDTTPPTIQASFINLVLAADNNCSALLPNLTGTNYILAADRSEPLTITQSPTNGTLLGLSTNTVVLTVVDAYGNAAYSTNTVMVRDLTPPLITLNGGNPIYVELGGTFTDPGAAASDACAGAVPVSTSGTVNTSVVGTNTLLYTATDGHGNTNTATRTVIVPDTTPPTILWSFTNLVLAAASNCTATLPNLTGTNYILASDFSAPLTILQSPTNGTVLGLSTNTVVLTVLDTYGNAAYSTNTVVVQDQTPPAITLNSGSPLYVELGTGFADPGASASDDCAGTVPVSVTGTVNANAVGTNTLLYTANDGNGNTNSATRTVIVHDTTPPAIQWSFTNFVLVAGISCTATLTNVTGTNFIQATDLSGPLTVTQNPTNGTALPLGTNPVVLTVVDAYGNAAYSTNSVTVLDQTPPEITLNGANPLYVELGSAFADQGAAAFDACAGTVAVKVSGSVNTAAVGTNTLLYTANDGHGNTNTTTRTVIVQDTTPPTIQWSFTNLVLAADNACSAVLPNLTGTNYILASDLSGPLTITQSLANGTALGLSTNTVVLTVLDGYGNAAYSTNTVVVRDQTPPSVVTQPQSQTNIVGTSAIFSVAATACTPVSYQWFFNTAALAGQTASSLTLSNLTSGSSGNYYAVCTASGGSTTSSVATLTINRRPSSLTLISSRNPSGFNDSVTFTATVAPTNATGTVQFYTNSATLESVPLLAAQSFGANISGLPRGTNLITAIYSGDAEVLPSTNILEQIVTNHPPTAAMVFYVRAAGAALNIALTNLAASWTDADGDPVTLVGVGVSTNGVAVTNNAGTLVYWNPNNVSDQFACAIADGWGGTNSQTVNIAVVTAAITGVNATNGNVTLSLAGTAGYAYALQATTTLAPAAWVPLATNVVGASGVWQFTDPQATNFPQRFYRLKLQ